MKSWLLKIDLSMSLISYRESTSGDSAKSINSDILNFYKNNQPIKLNSLHFTICPFNFFCEGLKL